MFLIFLEQMFPRLERRGNNEHAKRMFSFNVSWFARQGNIDSRSFVRSRDILRNKAIPTMFPRLQGFKNLLINRPTILKTPPPLRPS